MRIKSAIKLAAVCAVQNTTSGVTRPDLQITARSGQLPRAGRHVYRWGGRYALELEDCGARWVIRCGHRSAIEIDKNSRELCCHYTEANDLVLMGQVLCRRVLPRITGLHGRLVLHAATLSDGHGSVMLFGASGAGKSTTTAALSREFGWEILTDDMSIVSNDHRHRVWPTLPGVSLWLRSQQGLGLPEGACEPLQGYQDKGWYQSPRARPLAAAPLTAMIFLSRADDEGRVEAKRLSDVVKLMLAMPQMILFNPSDKDAIAMMTARLTSLATDIPAWSLAYPQTFEALPEVLNMIRNIHSDALCQTV